MKSDIDIKDDVWKIIKESSLLREVSGDLKKTSVRPKTHVLRILLYRYLLTAQSKSK